MIETNDNGEFDIPGVIPNLKFLIHGKKGARFLEPPSRSREKACTAQAGKTIDLGIVTLKDE